MAAGPFAGNQEALADGLAIASGIGNERWIHRPENSSAPEVTPEDARLRGQPRRPDAGGRYGNEACGPAPHRDPEALPEDAMLLTASSHGNIKNSAGHARNPAFGLALENGADRTVALGPP